MSSLPLDALGMAALIARIRERCRQLARLTAQSWRSFARYERVLPVDVFAHIRVALYVLARNDVPPRAADPGRGIDLIEHTRGVIRHPPLPDDRTPFGNDDR